MIFYIQKFTDPRSQWMFYVCLKRMCILLLLGTVFYKCQIAPFGCWWSVLWYPYLFFSIHSFAEAEVTVSNMWTCVFPFSSLSFCFIYFEGLVRSYTFGIAISFWWVDSFHYVMSLFILMIFSSLFSPPKLWQSVLFFSIVHSFPENHIVGNLLISVI